MSCKAYIAERLEHLEQELDSGWQQIIRSQQNQVQDRSSWIGLF
jgi:hypothetical protein